MGVLRIALAMFAALTSVVSAQTLSPAQSALPLIQQDVYEGTLGKAGIVVEILSSATPEGQPIRAARYFYKKYRVNLRLGVDQRGPRLILREYSDACYEQSDQCPTSASFTLSPTPAGLTGGWQMTGKLTALPVTLKNVGSRKVQGLEPLSEAASLYYVLDDLSDFDVERNPYLYRQLAQATKLGPETRVGTVGYQMATDTATGIHYPRLSRHPSALSLTRVNKLLDRERLMMVQYGLDCRGQSPTGNPSGGTLGGWDDYDSKVSYITESLMVIREGGSTYCGGAHPNNSYAYTQYDLRRGEVLNMNRLLKLYETHKDSNGYETQVATPEYQAVLAALKPGSKYAQGLDVPEECLSEDIGATYTLSFNAKGLVFSLTDLPHVMGACMGDYYVVPYVSLKPLWRKDAALYFPQAR